MTTTELKFRTNINCGGCIAAVKPYLDDVAGINSWQVDIAGKDKILTVVADGITEEQVIEALQKAGYKAELVKDKE